MADNTRREQMVRAAAHARKGNETKWARYHETHTAISVGFRNETLEALMEEAKQRGVTRSSLIKEAVELYVKGLRKSAPRGGWS